MKTKAIFLIFVFLCFSFSLFSQEPEDLISEGDKLFAEMKEMATAKEALAKYKEAYQEALRKAENRHEASWKLARIYYYIGAHTESKKEKKIIFSQGIYYANKAVAEEPKKPDGYYWLGVNQGVYGEAKGIFKSLALVKPIKQAMNKVIELDRTYEDGGADRVLGRVYFKVPGIAGGSKDKSLEHLLKSKELGPNDPVTLLYLAETLLSKKKIEEARAELEFVLNMEPDPRWVAGIEEAKEDAKKLLQDKKFRKKK